MYSLYSFKSKTKEYGDPTYRFVVENNMYSLGKLKKRIKEVYYYLDPDLRTLKIESLGQGRREYKSIDGVHHIFYNGESIVRWDDEAVRNYPEDLTWDRDISLLVSQVEKLKELEIKDKIKKMMARI